MRCCALVLFSVGIPVSCLATSELAFAGPCAMLDWTVVASATRTDTGVMVLTILEKVALGKYADISPESEAQVGITAGQLRYKPFGSPEVRMCALNGLGKIGLPEALDFLRMLRPTDVGIDSTVQIWPAAQDALANALLTRITDPHSRIEFLEQIVKDRAPATHWAIQQLCNAGVLTSKDIILEFLRRRMDAHGAEEEFRFCESRMWVVSRYLDRTKALGSVLTVANVTDADRLIRWAIYELTAMHSTDANAELERFAGEIGALPNRSDQKRRWSGFNRELEIWKEGQHDIRKASAN